MDSFAEGEVKDVTMEAVIIRADGTRENLGVISRMEVTPTLVEKIKRFIKVGE